LFVGALPINPGPSARQRTIQGRQVTDRLAPAGATPAGRITVHDYSRRIAAALAAVRTAERARGAARGRAIATTRALLAFVMIVVQAGPGDPPVTVRATARDIRADLAVGRLPAAAARLSALESALAAPAAQPAAPDARQLNRLDDILRNPPFTQLDTLWSIIGRWLAQTPLGAVWRSFVGFLQGLVNGSGAPIGNALPYVAALIVAAIAVYVVLRLRHPFVPHVLDAEGDDALLGGGTVRVDAAGARARAASLAAAGEYREAARYVFLGTLLSLDEAGRLRIDEATGNRDVLRQARAMPRLAEALAPVVRLFDLFWFGHAPVTRDEYEQYRQLNDRVLEVAR